MTRVLLVLCGLVVCFVLWPCLSASAQEEPTPTTYTVVVPTDAPTPVPTAVVVDEAQQLRQLTQWNFIWQVFVLTLIAGLLLLSFLRIRT